MSNKLSRTIALLLFLLLSSACATRTAKAPGIQVSPSEVVAGMIIRVTGTDWRGGERVEIGLKTSEQSPRQAATVTSVLTDAAGRFVAVFSFPSDVAWPAEGVLTIVAHNTDWTRTSQATVQHAVSATSTPAPVPTSSPAPVSPHQARVLGYVENLADGSGIIKLRVVEGPTDVIVISQQTQIMAGGQTIQQSDIRIGDLLEASGQLATNNRLVASQVRILVQNTALPPPTATLVPVSPTWRGEYYSNTTFSGRPALVREDPVIDFQWRDGSPAPELPADGFTVRWTGTWHFETGVYRFFAQVDDGVRLWIGRQLIIDQWHESSGALYSSDAVLSAGPQTVRVEYLESQANALARVWWEFRGPDATPVMTEWKGSYFAGMNLSGQPLFMVNERVIDFNWGAGSPFDGFPADQFSARWTRPLYLDSGAYRFHAAVDDGVRVIVDGIAIIDRWRDGGVETFAGDLVTESGIRLVTIEYYENGGQAAIRVWWELLPTTATPTATVSPTATATWAATLTPEPVESVTPEGGLPTPLPTDTATSTPSQTQPQPTNTPSLRPGASTLSEIFVPEINKSQSKDLAGSLAHPGAAPVNQVQSAPLAHRGGYSEH